MRTKTRKNNKIASLSPLQIQKLREYETEMGLILIAYEKEKSERNANSLGNNDRSLGENKI